MLTPIKTLISRHGLSGALKALEAELLVWSRNRIRHLPSDTYYKGFIELPRGSVLRDAYPTPAFLWQHDCKPGFYADGVH